jgi:hypothetical protein
MVERKDQVRIEKEEFENQNNSKESSVVREQQKHTKDVLQY